MFSVARDIEALRDSGAIGADVAAPLIAREKREVVSVYAELRFLTWAGVMLIVTGVGVLVKNHLDQIGPFAIALAIALGAAGCYAWAAYKHRLSSRAPKSARDPLPSGEAGGPSPSTRLGMTGIVDDYILLLAALLLSADAGYIEHTWHFLGANWKEYLLVLAIVHGITAYAFGSRLVLSVSLTSLAGYLGVQRSLDTIWGSSRDTALRAFVCATIVLVWRLIDSLLCGAADSAATISEGQTPRRLVGGATRFSAVFDHYAANLAFWGSLILCADKDLRLLGCAIALGVAAVSATYGVKTRNEMFLIYACVYGVIALDIAVVDLVPNLAALFIMMSSMVAVVSLFLIHARMRKEEA
ncbi:MAG TPA: DUF2157 domain-containing protein [Thermoanaerobaculia bacterium]|nr:DUF2157 domain-containing protein [Thermoanaerobaculia bacterium]